MRSATRVLLRFLTATAVPTAKQALEIFRRQAPRIRASLGEPDKAAQLYLEMAGEIYPLSKALEGVVIQRKDEQRKLENLKVLLRRLERATAPDSLKSYEADELESWIHLRLEGLEEILKSLVRTGERLSEYTEGTPKNFPHGKYTIVNHHGFRAEEVEPALKTLDDASAFVQAAGFGAAIYGEVILESPTKVNYAGLYYAQTDVIRLNVAARKRLSEVHTLTHEIGHRVWHKLLAEVQRDAYEDQYFGTATRAITLAEREAMWQAFQQAGFEARRVRPLLPADLRDLWSQYWKSRQGLYWPKAEELADPRPGTMSLETVHRNFVQPRSRYIVLDESVQSVTDYGKTNVGEDFAEVFAFYCMGKPLTADAKQRFSAATGRG